jgi:hypothetical protein
MLKFFILFLDIEGFYFCSWMLKVCDSWFFVYLHILKKNDVKIYSILFRSLLYKFNLIYNDERFLKGDFLMIIMLFYDDFYRFSIIGPNFHYVSIHQHQNYVYKVRFFQKYLKL